MCYLYKCDQVNDLELGRSSHVFLIGPIQLQKFLNEDNFSWQWSEENMTKEEGPERCDLADFESERRESSAKKCGQPLVTRKRQGNNSISEAPERNIDQWEPWFYSNETYDRLLTVQYNERVNSCAFKPVSL
jgi:hypothetical protein